MTHVRWLLGLIVPFALACASADAPASACASGDTQNQRHGTDCGCCHHDEFGVSGSVDLAGPAITSVHVTDAQGVELDMAPNAYGNFFRHYQPAFPLRARVVGPSGERVMQSEITTGSCNSCHREGGALPPLRAL